MRIGVLTSSRADYGIYRPLLKALKRDPFFNLSIIAFGTHVLPQFGNTIDQIVADGFDVNYTINSMLPGDSPAAIAGAVALTAAKFADFWNTHGKDFDLVFCLGDRYEMFGAVTAAIPFGIKFAHLHGGETTLGAIDNVYRHSITHASTVHFTSAEYHADRVRTLIEQKDNVYVCGALSIDNLQEMTFLSLDAFRERWSIDLNVPSVLITVHPETVHPDHNKIFVREFTAALTALMKRYQLVITMPNADTAGSVWRNEFKSLAAANPGRVFAIENFGTQSYFTCMKHVKFLLGNTSSGIIEAASLSRFVIDVGDRQKGRIAGENVMHVPFDAAKILSTVDKIEDLGVYHGSNPYFAGGATEVIINVLKKIKHINSSNS